MLVPPAPTAADSLLLASTSLATFSGSQLLTAATAFFFERDGALYLITSRHVLIDEASDHHPDGVAFRVHTDPTNLTQMGSVTLALYNNGLAQWRGVTDASGVVDIAALPVPRSALPFGALLHAFTPQHLVGAADRIEVGTPMLVVGFPLGFHDGLHHMPVVRQASLASAFGLRFQGHGYFLSDARTHRGTSGAPVVMRRTDDGADAALPWTLLGVHSSRMDLGSRDRSVDEALGLNCVWYADALLALTDPRPAQSAVAGFAGAFSQAAATRATTVI